VCHINDVEKIGTRLGISGLKLWKSGVKAGEKRGEIEV